MQINESKKLNVVVEFSKSLMLITVLGVLVLALHSPMLAVLLGGESTVQVQAAPTAVQPAAPTTVAPDVSAMADATAEGQDVLTLGFYDEDVPDELWNAVVDRPDSLAWYDDMDNGGYGVFSVPVGTAVTTASGVYVATHDGWLYGDTCTVAAGYLLDALNAGTWIEEDLSYRGMPAEVAQCNDELATAYYATRGHRFDFNKIGGGHSLRAFLEQRAIPQNLSGQMA